MKKIIIFNPVFVRNKVSTVLGAVLSLLLVTGSLNAQIDITLMSTSPTCNGYTDGMVESQVSGGTAPYSYLWSNGQTTQNLYGISGGTYTLNVSDATGNSGSAEITVEEPAELIVEIGVVGNVCLGTEGSLQAVVSGGTPPYEIIWNNGTIGVTNDNLQEGANTVNVTDANGCFDNALTIVGLPMSIEVVTTDVACGGGCDGSAEVIITGGQGPFTYLWSNGETGPILQNLEAGTFCVTVTDALGCSLEDCGEVGQPTDLDVSIDIVYDDVECGETVTATATVTVSGGEPPYNINWSNGNTGPVATGLTPGSYFVHVVDQNGCFKKLSFKIEKPPVLSCDVEVEQPDCLGGGTGSATVSGLGGTAPYSYLWSNGATTAMVDDLAPGNYEVTVTDDIGCEAICYATINPEGSVNFNLTAVNANCGVEGSIIVNITDGEAPFNISWVGPEDGSTTTSDNPYTIGNLDPGQYLVTVEDANGCIGTKTVRIENPGHIRFFLTPSPAYCGSANGSIEVTVTTGDPNFRIEWSGPVSSSVNNVPSPYTITDLLPGVYDILVMDANGCFDTTSTTVENIEYDIPLTITTECDDNDEGSISVSWSAGTAPYTLVWTTPDGTETEVTDATNPFDLTGLAVNGDYSFTVTDANGCDGTGEINVNCNPDCPLVCNASSTPDVCMQSNGSITVDITGVDGVYTIEWSGPSSGSDTSDSDTYTISGLPAGDYTIVITDESDPTCTTTCTATVAPEDYTIDLTLTPSCVDSIGSIDVSWTLGTAPFTLQWENPDGFVNTFTDVSSPINFTDLTLNGTYSATITDSNGSACESTGTVDLNCPDPCPLVCETSSTPDVCEQSNGTITVDISGVDGVYTIEWSGPVSGSDTSDSDTYTISNLPAGTYTIVITDESDATCITTCDATVDPEIYNIDLTITPSCVDSIGNINVSWSAGTAPYTLTWSDPNGTVEVINDATSPVDLPGLTVNGTYSFTITDLNNGSCEGTGSVNLVCPDPCPLMCTTSSTPDVCEQSNGTITVDISGVDGVYTIEWSGPSSGSDTSDSDTYTISGLSAGEYTIVITDESDITCMTTCTATVAPENYNIDLTITPSCVDSIGSINVSWSAGTAPYTLTWSDPNGTEEVINDATSPVDLTGLTVSGTYSFTITDVNSSNGICEGTGSVNLVCPDPCPLMCTATATDAICEQANGSITVNVSGIGSGYTIEWTGPSSGSDTSSDPVYTISDLAAGDYTVTLTSLDDSTCLRVHNVTVGQEEYDLGLVVTDECSGSSRTLNLNWIGIDATPPYELSWTDPNGNMSSTTVTDTFFVLLGISSDSSGLYTFTVTDSLGCSDTEEVDLEVCCPITCEGTSTPAYCGNDNGTITVTVSDYNGGEYDITWTGPSGGSETAVTTGTYTINNLPPGDYEITVIDGTNCLTSCEVTVGSETYDIDVQAGFECITDSTANITVTWSIGTAPHNLIWSGPNGQGETVVGATSPYVIDNVVNGEYTFTVIDTLGCDGMDTITVDCPDIPCQLECMVSSTPITCIDSTGTITVSVSGNSGPYSITLTPPGTTVTDITDPTYTFTDLPAGTYTVVVSDSTDCTVERTVTIEDESYDIPLTVTPECGDSTGTITVSWNVGTAPFTLNWSGPSGVGTVAGATSPFVLEGLTENGVYSFTITDTLGCSGSGSTELDCCFMRIMAESTPEDCLADNGTITVTISNGTAPYNIDWSGTESGSVSTANNPHTITNLTAGPYSIIVTDSLGCVDSLDIEVARIDTLSFDTDSRDIICETPGEICISNINGTPDFEISWTGPESGDTTISETGICLPITVPGDYVITVQDSIGCMAMSDTITIDSVGLSFDVKPKNRICETLGSIELCEITGSPDYEIMVTGPVNGVDTTITDTITVDNYSIDSLFAGTYFIKVTDANGCMEMDTVVIDSLDMLPFNVEVTDVICERRGEICVAIDCGTPDYEISLSGPVSETITTDSAHCFSNLPAGDYVIMVVDSLGCVGIDSVTVDSIDNLEIEAMAQNGLCGDSAYIDITILSGTPQFDIMWTGPVSGMDSTQNNTYGISITESGDYTIKVTDANGCMRDTTVTVIVSPPKEIEVGGVINETCDSLGKIIINVLSGTPECTITWEGDNGVNGSGVSSNGGYAICDLTAGTYTVIAVDTFNCADTLTVVVDGPEDVAVDIESTPQMCDSLGSIKLTYVTGNGYIVCTVQGPTIVTSDTLFGPNDMELIEGLLEGEYVIECIDSLGCSALDTIIVIENIDVLEFTATANNSECGEGLGTIDVDITEGMSPFTIDWTGPESGSITTDENTHAITELPNGDYTIKVTDSKGCMRDTTVTIDNGMAVDYDVEVIDITCDNPEGSIIISNLMGKPDYTITINDTLTVISSGGPDTIGGITQPGTYIINVVDSMNCSRDTTVEVGGPEELRIIVDTVQMICDALGSIKLTYDCGFGPAIGSVTLPGGEVKEFTLENPGDMFTCPGLTEGDYLVEVSDEGGNFYMETIRIVQVINEINVTINASAISILPDGSVDIQVDVDPPGDYTYIWNITDPDFIDDPNSPTPRLTPCVTTTYTLTVIDENGCEGQATITIEVPPVCVEPYVYIPNAFAPNGNDRNEVFRIRSAFEDQIQLVTFIVYDRWGEEVFKATNIKEGWDGTFKGEECPPDVFGYYIDVVCPDGNHFIRKGNVTLFR